jgi:alkylhydroperoxidase family enzyme
VIEAPGIAGRDPVERAIGGLARLVTEAPWTLRGEDLQRCARLGVDHETVLHVIVLSAFFGYLNRVADAVGIELDYEVAAAVPLAVAETAELPRPDEEEWPFVHRARPLDPSQREGLAEALAAWREHAMERDAPLSRGQRGLLARVAAEAVGDLAGMRAHTAAVATPLDRALAAYADTICRAPWRLGAEALVPLRELNLDDAAIFDVIATASYASFASRLAVALAALAR